MTDLTNEQIWEIRYNLAIERFKDYDECMEIPGYGVEPECPPTPIINDFQQSLERRFEACKQRYQRMEEYMEIPDMDLWLKLKEEIIMRQVVFQTVGIYDLETTVNDMKSKISYLEDKIEELLSSKNEDYIHDYEDKGPMHISELQTDIPKKNKSKLIYQGCYNTRIQNMFYDNTRFDVDERW